MTTIALTCIFVTVILSIVASAQDDFPWGAEETAFFMGLGLITCLIISIVVSLVIAILACIWIYKDAEKRGKQGILWVLLLILAAIFLSFIGLIIVIVVWLAIRPPIGGKPAASSSDRRCPNCGRVIPMDARVCPYCSKKFEE